MSLSSLDINLVGIGQLLQDGKYTVPLFQRAYAWEEDNVKNLLNDFQHAVDNNVNEYFLGSIVIAESNTGVREVVDGQQRLSTTQILIACIRDYLIENDENTKAQNIEHTYLSQNDLMTDELIGKFKLSQVDNEYYQNHILFKPSDRPQRAGTLKPSHKRIQKSYNLIDERIRLLVSSNPQPITYLIKWINFIKDSVKVIRVLTPSDLNAFVIFETLNDRGLELAVSDLLKNYLFSLSEDRLDEVQGAWSEMIGALESQEPDGRIILEYLRHLWCSKYGATREKDLYANIKEKIISKSDCVQFATSLRDNAKVYCAIQNPEHEFWISYGSDIKGSIITLNILKQKQIRPVIIAILNKFSTSEIKKSFKYFVSLAVRISTVGGFGSWALEESYSSTAVKIMNGTITNTDQVKASLTSVVPADNVFKDSFKIFWIKNMKLARYILRSLEKTKNNESEPELVPNDNEQEVNLEHILPKNIQITEWPNWTQEDAENYVHRLGNMAIMKSSENSRIGNASFNDKKLVFSQSSLTLTSNISNLAQWTPSEIESRQNELAELAVSTWKV